MIDITNVVNISVSAPAAGLAGYSINNLMCITKDTPVVGMGTAKYKVYTNPTDVGADWGTTSLAYKAAIAVFSQSPNILTGEGKFLVAPMITDETLDDAITRLMPLVFFGGCSYAFAATSNEIKNAAAICQSARKLFFVSSHTASDLITPGLIFTIQGAKQTYTRCVYYTDSAVEDAFRWGYAGRAMSTQFSGSNTTQSMHLKQIANVVADAAITSTILANAQTVGADVYVDIAGRPSLFTAGANSFFDDVYNLLWFVLALEVNGFNALATTSTKLPQTEQGMDYLKGEYRKVCDQAVANRFVGRGAWNSPDTFGVQADFVRNIGDVGYYLYSQPVNQQSQVDRAARKAPIVQIAVKYQGAIHSSSVIVNVNA